MNGFMVLMNLITTFLLLFAITFLLSLKRTIKHEFSRLNNKKKELEEIISSADQMIEELNNFSDYLITNLEDKTIAVGKMVNDIEEKIEENRELVNKAINIVEYNKEENMSNLKPNINTVIPFHSKLSSPDKLISLSKASLLEAKDKSSKSMQILMLAEKGYNEAEIARKLGIGRGEIQLILGMRKGIMEA